jgi:acetyl esterase/lipase
MEAMAMALAQVQPALLTASVADQRATWESGAGSQVLPPGTEVRQRMLGGVPTEEVVAVGADRRLAVMHFHGGGYGIGSAVTHRAFAARLSAAVGRRVLVPEYRLAPEHLFPAAVEDAVSAYEVLAGELGTTDAISVSGDSAGGGLALSLLLVARDRRTPLPGSVVCWSPWVDLTTHSLDDPELPNDPVLTRDWLAKMASNYLGGTDASHPLASPIHGDLSGLPPVLVLAGDRELLSRQADLLVARARDAGVDAELERLQGAIHLWMIWLPDALETRMAMERAATFVRSHALRR